MSFSFSIRCHTSKQDQPYTLVPTSKHRQVPVNVKVTAAEASPDASAARVSRSTCALSQVN